MDTIIKKTLISNRIFPNAKGYKYCVELLKYLINEGFSLKYAYELTGKKYSIKANSVEKSVSNVISKAFLNKEMQQKYENLCFSTGKINNKVFIDILKCQILSHKLKSV